MYRTKTKKYQWALDLLFGAILIIPLIAFSTGVAGHSAVFISIGSALGYIIHVTQKMMIFDDMLKESIQDEAKHTIKKEAKETVEKEAEKQAEEKVEKKIEETPGFEGEEITKSGVNIQ